MFYYDHAVWLQNGVHDLNDTLIQDMFILNMYNSRGLFQRVQRERASGTDSPETTICWGKIYFVNPGHDREFQTKCN